MQAADVSPENALVRMLIAPESDGKERLGDVRSVNPARALRLQPEPIDSRRVIV